MHSFRASKLDCAAAFIIGSLIALLITAPVATAHPTQPQASIEWRNSSTSADVISITSNPPDTLFHDALQ